MFIEKISKTMFRENEHSDYTYASESDYCMRKTFYKRTGLETYHNFSTEVNFKQGNAIHSLLQDLFVTNIAPSMGYRAFKEVRINNDFIHGFIDVMLVNNESIVIIEIKTTKSLPAEPLTHHLTQINTYMHPYFVNKHNHRKTVLGVLLYVEKAIIYGNSPQREFVISYDDDLYNKTLVRAKQVKYYLDNEILPPAEAMINGNVWECKYCSFLLKCRQAGISGAKTQDEVVTLLGE